MGLKFLLIACVDPRDFWAEKIPWDEERLFLSLLSPPPNESITRAQYQLKTLCKFIVPKAMGTIFLFSFLFAHG